MIIKRSISIPFRISTLVVLIFLCATVFAQTEKGRFLIGGGVDINSSRQNNVRRFNMNISPTFGVFVVKNFAVGARYSFGVGSVRSFDKKDNKYVTVTSFTTSIGPNLKYYFGKKALKGFVGANAGYVVFTQLNRGNVFNYNGFTAGGNAGMAYFLNNHIALESGMYFTAAGYEGEFPTTRIGFSVGLFVFLNKKKQEQPLIGPNEQ